MVEKEKKIFTCMVLRVAGHRTHIQLSGNAVCAVVQPFSHAHGSQTLGLESKDVVSNCVVSSVRVQTHCSYCKRISPFSLLVRR